jgi:peptidyl-prolyl cis-trans isomerase SurA
MRRAEELSAIALAGFLLLRTMAAAQTPQPLPALSMPQAPMPKGAVVLDHVVAVINGSIILQSDVDEELRYSALTPFTTNGGRNTPQRALERLIDRDLILQQMKMGAPIAPPTPQDVQQRIAELRSATPQCVQYHCETDAGWRTFLASKGLTEAEVVKRWTERLTILSFIQSRFGAGVHITPAEIEDYYKQQFVPQFQDKKLQAPPLSSVSIRINEILLQQRVSSLLLEWLQSLKSEGSVSILDPHYGQVGTTGAGDEESGGPS